MLIQNYETLNTTPQRKIVLDLIEAALEAIEPKKVLAKTVTLENDVLKIQQNTYDLKKYERIFLIGFGKGSAGICKLLEEKLGNKLVAGYDIDVVDEKFTKIHYTKGTHPLPSEENIAFTKTVLEQYGNKLTEKDLVLVVVCGGGAVLFGKTHKINLETLISVNKALLKCGATISEMNIVRKHLSNTKGGGLAKMLYPAAVATLIFSDVPGNDLFVIASGSTVKDPTTMIDVQTVIDKYNFLSLVSLTPEDFHETPKEDKYFEKVTNTMILSNQICLTAMQEKAKEFAVKTFVYSDKLQGNAKEVGKQLLDAAKSGQILLAGGETTVKVSGSGQGGRNQSLVLASLQHLDDKTVIASFDSDGWDFYGFAGAIGDAETIKKSKELSLNQQEFLDNDDSYSFFEKVGDGLLTGKLESNVSDIMLVYKS